MKNKRYYHPYIQAEREYIYIYICAPYCALSSSSLFSQWAHACACVCVPETGKKHIYDILLRNFEEMMIHELKPPDYK